MNMEAKSWARIFNGNRLAPLRYRILPYKTKTMCGSEWARQILFQYIQVWPAVPLKGLCQRMSIFVKDLKIRSALRVWALIILDFCNAFLFLLRISSLKLLLALINSEKLPCWNPDCSGFQIPPFCFESWGQIQSPWLGDKVDSGA